MSQNNKFPGVPAHPIKVETDLFGRTQRNTEFWVGICEHFGDDISPELTRGARELVANTYIDEQRIFPESKRAELLGRSHDPVARMSQRFVMLRRSLDHDEPFAELFATAQNITRLGGPFQPPLPIEDIFPELFPDPTITDNSVEITRLTSRYPGSKTIGHLGFISLMRTSFALAREINATAIYAMTEPHVAKIVASYGLSVEPLGEPKKVQEEREDLTTLVPLRFEVAAIDSLRDEQSPGYSPLSAHYLAGIDEHQGLGFFDQELLFTEG